MNGAGAHDIESIIASLRKRALTVVLMTDVSGSVKGERLDAVNAAMRNAVSRLRDVWNDGASAEIHVAVMEFASSAVWRTPVPVPVSDFRYEDIARTGGGTNYSNAFKALGEKLSDGAFTDPEAGSCDPVLILLTDGKPSDPFIYGDELDRLRECAWFLRALKAGVAIGEGASSEECLRALTEFTGDKRAVYPTDIRGLIARVERIVLKLMDLSAKRPPAVITPPVDTRPANPSDWDDPEIPGFEDIDWERDFPPFEG
ncbi:MAG: VWA domain-containing protein [Synergistaceae bacterium]|jgi:uncharacterized protein YegL|nr:VWA domain-containing protein [Synergistaceae bacterium]